MVYCHLNWVPRRLELRSPLKAGPVVDMLAGSAEIRYCGDKGLSRADSPPLLTLQPELFTLLLEASRNTFRPSPRSMCRKKVGNKPQIEPKIIIYRGDPAPHLGAMVQQCTAAPKC